MLNYWRYLFAQPSTDSARTLQPQPQQIGRSAQSQTQFKIPPTESLANDILAAKKAVKGFEEKLKTQHGCVQNKEHFIENKHKRLGPETE